MDSQLPLDQFSESSFLETACNTPHVYSTDDDDLPSRPPIAPTIPPGFERTEPVLKSGSQGPSDMNYHVQVALLEQELMNRNAQWDEAIRANAHLRQSRQDEAAKVFELVRELQHCERRTAKSEIAVEYFAELSVQMAAKIKQHQEPDRQIYALKEELQHANYDSQSKILALETVVQNLKLDNEKLTSKLQSAMDTIIALSSVAISSQKSCGSKSDLRPVAGVVQHNNLIDLMDDCLAPTQHMPTEDPSTTLLDDIDDVEEINMPATAEPSHSLSDSFDSDFSNSSYIVRFKEIRDMTKENAALSKWANLREEQNATDKQIGKVDHERPQDPSLSTGSSSDEDSAPSAPASPQDSQYDGSVDLSPAANSANQKNNIVTVPQTQSKDPPELDTITDENSPSSKLRNISGSPQADNLPVTPKLTPGKIFPLFKTKAEKEDTIRLHKKTVSRGEEMNLPEFFEYGIQFHPHPGSSEVYRTLLISNLAANVTLLGLMDKVRGGAIFDAKLLVSTSTITGNPSALISFLEERAALAYRKYLSENPILLCGSRMEVTLLTPTWPIKPWFRKKISDHQMTRCLEVNEFPKNISQRQLKEDLQVCRDITTTWVTFLHLNKDGLLKIHFSSIMQASHAHQMFSSNKNYAKCTPYFIPDPCAQPLETLKQTESKPAKIVWERHEEVAGGNNKMDEKLIAGVQHEKQDLSGNVSMENFPHLVRNDHWKTFAAENQSAKSGEVKATCSEPVTEMSIEALEASSFKNPTVEDEITEAKGGENFGLDDNS